MEYDKFEMETHVNNGDEQEGQLYSQNIDDNQKTEILLRIGSKKEEVITVQKHLNHLAANNPSMLKLKEDGIFGAGTQHAVMVFQKMFGLSVDGVVDPITFNMMIKKVKEISTENVIVEKFDTYEYTGNYTEPSLYSMDSGYQEERGCSENNRYENNRYENNKNNRNNRNNNNNYYNSDNDYYDSVQYEEYEPYMDYRTCGKNARERDCYMCNYTKQELEEALGSIVSILNQCEGALPRLRMGTSTHTMQVRRIKSLRISMELVERELYR